MRSEQYSNTNHIYMHPAPSFSSTLLDEIYRSIDDIDQAGGDENMNINAISSMRKKQSSTSTTPEDEEIFINASNNFQRACMMEKKKKKKKKKVGGLRDDYQKRPKPIRVFSDSKNNHLDDGIFIKTKSRALKQPISPGARLAGFLNSLFTKRFINNNNNSPSTTTCSSSASNSSSSARCKTTTTPSSRGSKSDHKRSVRFSPVEDFQIKKHNLEAINQAHVIEINNRRLVVEEAARDFLRNYQKKDFHQQHQEEDDDAASYASSDLFELDNLSAIGMESYREELPVYETTHLHTNRAIASGLIL